jgi:1,4-alpha-glucan branching enzyme
MKRTETGWIVSYVLGPGNYQYKFVVDGEWVTDPANTSVVDDKKGNQNSFLVIKPNYRFRLRGYEKARNVFVAGDFNDWAENLCPLKKVNGEWIADAYLGRGKHRYKFIVDGKWILDPANKLWEDNEHGTGNSVVWLE